MGTIPFKASRVSAAVKSALGTTTVTVPLLFAAMPAVAQSQQDTAEELRTLRYQVKQMQDKMDAMEAEGDSSGSGGPIQWGDTEFEFGGYFKFDAVYDFEDDHGPSLGPSDAIGTRLNEGTDSPGDQNIGATVKQTRLTMTTSTPSALGDIGTYIETDLYGDTFGFGGSVEPRVRRAYLTIGNWLIGRDWTTFSDFNYGTMLNFYGPQSQIFERQAQVRYTFDFGEGGSLAMALENSEGGSVVGSESVFVDDDEVPDFFVAGAGPDQDSSLPDFTIRYQGEAGPLSFQVAGLARQITADIGDDEDSVFGWGLDAGASLGLPTGTTLMASLVYGEGIGKYVYMPAGGADAYVTSDGGLEAYERYGFVATISQELTSEWTANVVYGRAYSEDPDNVDYETGTLHDTSSTIAANLLYTPVEPLTFGIEYNRAYYEQQDGIDATANNVQFSTIYNFF